VEEWKQDTALPKQREGMLETVRKSKTRFHGDRKNPPNPVEPEITGLTASDWCPASLVKC
jgi:hypothetical protein